MSSVVEQFMFQDGFFTIPGFPNYMVSEKGVLLNLRLGRVVHGCKNPDGYHNFRLRHGNGRYLTIGRHRVLGMAFLKCPGDFCDFVINHINGKKGDDRLDNLEWCTYRENLSKAVELGKSEKMKAVWLYVAARRDLTGFDCYKAAAEALCVSKDTIPYRLSRSDGRFLLDGIAYFRNAPTTNELSDLTNLNTGRQTEVWCLDLRKGDVLYFPSLSSACTSTGVNISSLSVKLGCEPVVFLNRYVFSSSAQRIANLDQKALIEDVLVTCGAVCLYTEKSVRIYTRQSELARDLGVGKTTLSYWLKNCTRDNICKYRKGDMVRFNREVKLSLS